MKTKEKIIIPDTNFLIEHGKEQIRVLEILPKHGDVYLSEITVEERLAQTRRDLKLRYAEIEKVMNSQKNLVTVSYKKTLEEQIKHEEERWQKIYKSEFIKSIIKFPKDEKMFSLVLERAYDKIAPFIDAHNASDKGFKDTLLWISLLHFFKDYKDDKDIILITNDKGFLYQAKDKLEKEFLDFTKKTIQIKPNSYYNDLIGVDMPKDVITQIKKEISDIERNELREEINSILENICIVEETESNWISYPTEAFVIGKPLTNEIIAPCFANLEKLLSERIFEKNLFVSNFLLGVPIDDKYKVDIQCFEALQNLYKKIKTNYKDYLPQFYNAACSIINRNYSNRVIEMDNLPF